MNYGLEGYWLELLELDIFDDESTTMEKMGSPLIDGIFVIDYFYFYALMFLLLLFFVSVTLLLLVLF
jgi:hypothetical protein